MKVLVTGGMGFVGSHTVDLLLSLGHEVTLLDRYKRDNPWDGKVGVNLGDVRDREAVEQAICGQDAVIHLAGILGTMETVGNPKPSVDTNIHGTLNVLEACRPSRMNKNGVRGVYISVGNHFMNNTYAITKSAAERFTFMYNKEHGTNVAVVRGLNAYGERQKHKPVRKIIPNFVLRALKGVPIEIFGDGEQVMDMIYVGDLAKVLVNAIFTDHGRYDLVFEAGTGRETTVNQIANLIIEYTGSKGGVKHIGMRPGEPERSVVLGNPETLKPLGINKGGLVTLEEGLIRTVDWYRKRK